jgi:hypothetical protein
MTINNKEVISGHIAYDGNSVVMGGGVVKTEPDGTSYDIDEMIGVRLAVSGMTASSMSGTYNLVSQEQSFFASSYGNVTNVSDNIYAGNASATFNGKGGCTVTMNGTGYFPNGSGGVTVQPESGTQTCTYTITPTGTFTINFGGTDIVTGWASADGNSVVMGGATKKSDTDGTNYRTELIVGVKAGTAMDVSSVTGTYHLTGADIAFYQSSNYITKNYWGSQSDINFNGAGVCTLTTSGTGYHVETGFNGDQSVVTDSEAPQTITDCSYTINTDGNFTVTLITPDGIEDHYGWASADGNSVVMGGAIQDSDSNGTNFNAELMFGVKVKP